MWELFNSKITVSFLLQSMESEHQQFRSLFYQNYEKVCYTFHKKIRLQHWRSRSQILNALVCFFFFIVLTRFFCLFKHTLWQQYSFFWKKQMSWFVITMWKKQTTVPSIISLNFIILRITKRILLVYWGLLLSSLLLLLTLFCGILQLLHQSLGWYSLL